jgi:hypothetical protein
VTIEEFRANEVQKRRRKRALKYIQDVDVRGCLQKAASEPRDVEIPNICLARRPSCLAEEEIKTTNSGETNWYLQGRK